MQIKDYILDVIDQAIIFSKYLGISPDDIKYTIYNPNEKIKNPLRVDKHPSLSFKYYGNKLICKDFGDGRFRGDVFEIAGYVLGKNCKNAEDFIYICNDIILRCSQDITFNIETSREELKRINKHNIEIDIDIKRPNKIDYVYWETYGINKEYLNKYVYVVDRYRLDGWQTPYRYSGVDPCYAYYVNPNKYKLYFPRRNKHQMKFITNNRCPIECLHTLKTINYIVLIKGYKDKILLNRICDEYNVNDILFLPAASETIVLPKDIYKLLISHSLSGKIFTMFDTDAAGIKSAQNLQSEYNTIPIYFTGSYRSKDPSDMVKDYGYKKVFTHFNNVLKKIYYGD